MKKLCLLLALTLFLMAAVSCIGVQGGDGPRTSPTLGQELIDLKKARDEGAITYREYTQLKATLVESYE